MTSTVNVELENPTREKADIHHEYLRIASDIDEGEDGDIAWLALQKYV